MSQKSQNASSKCIIECVRYILYREGSKIPISHAEIKKYLKTKYQVSNSDIKDIITNADYVLKNVYGYTLVKDTGKNGIRYFVVLVNPCCDSPASPLINKYEQQLLNAALSHIFMSTKPVKDEDMWKFLEETELISKADDTIRNLFTKKFTSQCYITCTKTDGITTFEWGPRANIEGTKMFFLEKVALALGKEPKYWQQQFLSATEQTTETENRN